MLQFVVAMSLVFCWSVNPGAGESHETTPVLVAVSLIRSNGGGIFNKYAAPASMLPVPSRGDPIMTKSPPIAAKA